MAGFFSPYFWEKISFNFLSIKKVKKICPDFPCWSIYDEADEFRWTGSLFLSMKGEHVPDFGRMATCRAGPKSRVCKVALGCGCERDWRVGGVGLVGWLICWVDWLVGWLVTECGWDWMVGRFLKRKSCPPIPTIGPERSNFVNQKTSQGVCWICQFDSTSPTCLCVCVCVFFLKNGCHKENNFPRQKRLSVQNLPTLGLFYLSTPARWWGAPRPQQHVYPLPLTQQPLPLTTHVARGPHPRRAWRHGWLQRGWRRRLGQMGQSTYHHFHPSKKKTGFDWWLMDQFFVGFLFFQWRKKRKNILKKISLWNCQNVFPMFFFPNSMPCFPWPILTDSIMRGPLKSSTAQCEGRRVFFFSTAFRVLSGWPGWVFHRFIVRKCLEMVQDCTVYLSTDTGYRLFGMIWLKSQFVLSCFRPLLEGENSESSSPQPPQKNRYIYIYIDI